jgi:hypothetical protein
MIDIVYTNHVRERQAQRNLTTQELEFVMFYGRRYYRAGVVHIFLGRRDIPQDRVTYKKFAHLEGTIVLYEREGTTITVVTAYRDRNGCKDIRKKKKYDRRSKKHRRNPGVSCMDRCAVWR